MTLAFPPSFFFGTSTSACQTETAFEHDWKGVVAKDGFVLDRTTDHEQRIAEDVDIVASLAPNYRMSLMWSRLQRRPYASFDNDAVKHYHLVLDLLSRRNVRIMMVLHHWCNPVWFCELGGWESRESVSMFFDFASRLIDEFGNHVTWWNTFNEPNLYATFAYGIGEFPPYVRDVFKSVTVIKNMSEAHERICNYIRQKQPHSPVGISQNCVSFSSDNLTGVIPSRMAEYWYMEYLPGFFEVSDFIGLSYYARLGFDPFPVTFLQTPEKFANNKRRHDDIWEYYPEGMGEIISRYWSRFRKPVIITENGICTSDDAFRENAIKDYMVVIHSLLNAGVDIRGYFHWSAWDNFEWTLGPSYKFGLYSCDPLTKVRARKKSADLYAELAYGKTISI